MNKKDKNKHRYDTSSTEMKSVQFSSNSSSVMQEQDDISYIKQYRRIIQEANLPYNYIPVRCCSRTLLNDKVIRLRFKLISSEVPFIYRGGQYIHFTRASDSLTRRYSLASCPDPRCENDELEIQVRAIMGGAMTNWLLQNDHYVIPDSLSNGSSDEVHFYISGPDGTGFYAPPPPLTILTPISTSTSSSSNTDHDLPSLPHRIAMVGIGTGLSPLWAILRDALIVHGNSLSEVHLFHVNYRMDTAYYVHELKQMENEFANFHYHPCVKVHDCSSDPIEKTLIAHGYSITKSGVHVLQGGRRASFEQVLFHVFGNNFRNCDLYLCGLDKRMQGFEQRLQSHGADPIRIFRDRYWK